MEHVRVKICGITNLADARYCAGAGAEYLGFIQSSASPRYVEPDTAREIIEWVAGVKTVGVFVDADVDLVNSVVSSTGFDVVQLHGEESPEYCSVINRPVVKAFRIRADAEPDDVNERLLPYVPYVSAFLFDTYVEAKAGGTGKTFPWPIVSDVRPDLPVFLAGGLSPDNVTVAVETVRPFGIDISSGVETAPGQKDFEAVDKLFEALTSYREA